MECDLDPISNCNLLASFPLMDTKVDHVNSVIMAFVVLKANENVSHPQKSPQLSSWMQILELYSGVYVFVGLIMDIHNS